MSEPKTRPTRVTKAIDRLEGELKSAETQPLPSQARQTSQRENIVNNKANSQTGPAKVNASSKFKKTRSTTTRGFRFSIFLLIAQNSNVWSVPMPVLQSMLMNIRKMTLCLVRTNLQSHFQRSQFVSQLSKWITAPSSKICYIGSKRVLQGF